MSGRWTRRWASCARGRNRAQAKRRRRDRRMRARRVRCCGCAGASGKPPQRRWPVVRRREEGRRGERRQAFLAGGLYLIMIAPKGGEFSRTGQKNENRCVRASGREPFFVRERGGRGRRGRRSGRQGCGADLYKAGKRTDGGKKRGRGVDADRRRTGRVDGWGRRAEAKGEKKSGKRRRVRGSVRGKKLTGKGIEKDTGSAGRSGKLRREGEMVEKVRMEWAVGRASAWGEDAEKLIKRRRSS